ncbi:MAG TPA: acylphosphatase, partial [Xanthobacteraceae bacterium]|nr:acylphosphatase [Xanthobacteraceae bacterium]
MSDIRGAEIIVRGIVQGVGFRPFVWRLAQRLGLFGEVRNAGDAVFIHAGGTREALAGFVSALREEAPVLSRVETITAHPVAPPEGDGFRIVESGAGAVSIGIVPDIAT